MARQKTNTSQTCIRWGAPTDRRSLRPSGGSTPSAPTATLESVERRLPRGVHSRRRTVGLLATVLPSLMLVQAPSPMAMDTGSISGTIVDAVSHVPIDGARVMLVTILEADGGATLGDDGRRTVSDANGRFTFQQLSSGRYRVDAEKSGFAPSFDPFDSK